MATMRERFRAQVRDDVKQAALRQLAESGPQGVSVNAIAKELGVSGPALYRYFAGRDALLAELILDAYNDLADRLASAVDAASRHPSADRLRAFARAYRTWALEYPHRYQLLFGPPVPGYDAHAERLVEAAWRSMTTLLEVVRDLPAGDRLRQPSPTLARQLDGWAAARGIDGKPAAALQAIVTWGRLHGIISLEIAGNYDSMGLDADEIFEHELLALV